MLKQCQSWTLKVYRESAVIIINQLFTSNSNSLIPISILLRSIFNKINNNNNIIHRNLLNKEQISTHLVAGLSDTKISHIEVEAEVEQEVGDMSIIREIEELQTIIMK